MIVFVIFNFFIPFTFSGRGSRRCSPGPSGQDLGKLDRQRKAAKALSIQKPTSTIHNNEIPLRLNPENRGRVLKRNVEQKERFEKKRNISQRLFAPECRLLLRGRRKVSNKIENKIKIEKRKTKQHGEFQKREFFVKK